MRRPGERCVWATRRLPFSAPSGSPKGRFGLLRVIQDWFPWSEQRPQAVGVAADRRKLLILNELVIPGTKFQGAPYRWGTKFRRVPGKGASGRRLGYRFQRPRGR